MAVQISIYLDTRKVKKDGTYPVKVRVWSSVHKKAKLFPTALNLTEKEFQSAWETLKPRKEHKELRSQLQHLLTTAETVAGELAPFSFEAFAKKLYREAGDAANVFWYYGEVMRTMEKRGQVSNADLYGLSMKSLQHFLRHEGRSADRLLFQDITKDFLEDYEGYMLLQGRSRTTVSIYLRALRAVFNAAIAAGEIKEQIYPFGKGKYKVPATRNVKKALSTEALKALFHATPANALQEKAKAFWFFSYAANGMNMKDIAELKYRDIHESSLVFYRGKTLNTTRDDLQPIRVYLTAYLLEVIEQYGNQPRAPQSYIFPVLTEGLTPKQERERIKNFIKFVNKHLRKLAASIGITTDLTTYWARHSFTTKAIRDGASMEFIQESLGHKNIKTTMNYWAGFEEDAKREISEKLLKF